MTFSPERDGGMESMVEADFDDAAAVIQCVEDGFKFVGGSTTGLLHQHVAIAFNGNTGQDEADCGAADSFGGTAPATGTFTITATYAASSDYLAGTSSGYSVAVNGG